MNTYIYRLLRYLHGVLDRTALVTSSRHENEVMYHRLSGKWTASSRRVGGQWDPETKTVKALEGGPTWEALVFVPGQEPVTEHGFADLAEADMATQRLIRTHLGRRIIIHERVAS